MTFNDPLQFEFYIYRRAGCLDIPSSIFEAHAGANPSQFSLPLVTDIVNVAKGALSSVLWSLWTVSQSSSLPEKGNSNGAWQSDGKCRCQTEKVGFGLE